MMMMVMMTMIVMMVMMVMMRGFIRCLLYLPNMMMTQRMKSEIMNKAIFCLSFCCSPQEETLCQIFFFPSSPPLPTSTSSSLRRRRRRRCRLGCSKGRSKKIVEKRRKRGSRE